MATKQGKTDDLFAGFELFDDMPKSLKSQGNADPVIKRREKMLKAIEGQRKLWNDPAARAEAQANSKRNGEWWRAEGEAVYVKVRYGVRAVEISPGKTTVKLPADQVERFLDTVKLATEKGKLDRALEKASERTTPEAAASPA